jgi:hypothetical protein
MQPQAVLMQLIVTHRLVALVFFVAHADLQRELVVNVYPVMLESAVIQIRNALLLAKCWLLEVRVIQIVLALPDPALMECAKNI